MAQRLTNLTGIHEDTGLIPASLSGLRTQHCCELCCRSQTWLRSRIAVAPAQAGTRNHNRPLAWETPICHRSGPKKEKQKKKKKSSGEFQWDWQCLRSTGMQVRSLAQHSGLRIQSCHSCGLCYSYNSDLIPSLGTPCAKGQSKKKKKKLSNGTRNCGWCVMNAGGVGGWGRRRD